MVSFMLGPSQWRFAAWGAVDFAQQFRQPGKDGCTQPFWKQVAQPVFNRINRVFFITGEHFIAAVASHRYRHFLAGQLGDKIGRHQ